MKRLIFLIIPFLLSVSVANAALNASTIWSIDSGATAGAVNGGGFNTANAFFPTDGSWTSANTNAPVISSATYTFVAGDVGAWVYSKDTSNPGFYKISAVNAGAATVNGTIGQGMIKDAVSGLYKPSTIIGVDSSASVATKTYGVNYALGTSPNSSVADLASVGASTTMTSTSNPWTPVSVGNLIHITTTGTGAHCVVGWYEIAQETLVSSVVLDRTPNDGVAGATCTGATGGAISLNSALDDSLFEAWVAGNQGYAKGTLSLGQSVSMSSSACGDTAQCWLIGYASLWGDNPSPFGASATAPTINMAGGVSWTWSSDRINTSYFGITGTAGNGFAGSQRAFDHDLRIINTSTTAGRAAYTPGAVSSDRRIEAIAQNGIGILMGSEAYTSQAYAHDSVSCTSDSGARAYLNNSLLKSCMTNGIQENASTNTGRFINNTIYGYVTPLSGSIGISLANATTTGVISQNNIIYGFATGITQTTAQLTGNRDYYNDFFNNTANVGNWTLDITDLTLDPQFTTPGTEITGTTATSSGSVLTDGAANFSSVVDNQTFLHIISGTGVTALRIYMVTSHTTTTLTVNNALGTGSSIIYTLPLNSSINLGIGTNLKAQGSPGAFPNISTTSYTDIGGVQRQETSSGGSTGFFIQ